MKKKYIYIILSFTTVLLLLFIGISRNRSISVSYLPITNKIIGIDPGHGGVDPGAIGISGVREDEINLKIGLKLKRFIEQSGGIVVMTRVTDEGLYTKESKTIREMKTEDLHNRKKIIEDGQCHVFITIHLNSFGQSQYYGAQTFYGEGNQDSILLSNYIQDELKKVLDKNNNRLPQKRDNVFLLNEIQIPSVLVECGFLSNSKEEKLLNTDKYQEKIAWAIYVGIMRYFNEINGKYSF